MLTAKKTMRLGLIRIFFWAAVVLGAPLTDGMLTNAGAQEFEKPLIYFSRAGCGPLGVMESGTWTGFPLNPFGIRHRVTSFHYNYLEIGGLNGPVKRWVRRDSVKSLWHGPNSGQAYNWRVVAGHYAEFGPPPRVRGNHWARGNAIGGPVWFERKTDAQVCFPGAE